MLDALDTAKFLAALKSSHHANSNSLSVYFAAISFVLSVEPVSTTTISMLYRNSLLRHCSMYCSSFFAIIHTLTGNLAIMPVTPSLFSLSLPVCDRAGMSPLLLLARRASVSEPIDRFDDIFPLDARVHKIQGGFTALRLRSDQENSCFPSLCSYFTLHSLIVYHIFQAMKRQTGQKS